MSRKERYFEGGTEVTYQGDEESRRSIETSFKNRIYRHGDAERIERLFEEHQTIIIEAEMGAGKSSVLRSLTENYHEDELLFFNGHNFGSDPRATESLKTLLDRATQKTKLVVVDSADYLFQSKKFIRSGAKDYQSNCKERMQLLVDFCRTHPEVNLLMTSHDDNWKKIRGDEELMSFFEESFPDAEKVEPSKIVPETTVVRFLQHEQNLTREEAWYMATLWENPIVFDQLNEMGKFKTTDTNITDLFRTPKIHAQIFRKFPKLKDQLKEWFTKAEGEDRTRRETEWIKAYIRGVLTTDYQSIFLPIITATRGAKREAIWGVIEPLDEGKKPPIGDPGL